MSIVDALKVSDARITVGHRWLMAFAHEPHFEVMEKKPRQRFSRTIYQGNHEEDAVAALMKS
jgi:hypothetical protein